MSVKEWAPTAADVYLRHGNLVEVDPSADRVTRLQAAALRPDQVVPGGWSMLEPDWQVGAPTREQIAAWAGWAMQTADGIVMGCWGYLGDAELYGVTDLMVRHVVRSAPIQPDWTDGPRWVPLSVAR